MTSNSTGEKCILAGLEVQYPNFSEYNLSPYQSVVWKKKVNWSIFRFYAKFIVLCNIFPKLYAKRYWDRGRIDKEKENSCWHSCERRNFHKHYMQFLTSNFLSSAFYFCQHLCRIKALSPIRLLFLSYTARSRAPQSIASWGLCWTEKLQCIIKVL